VPVRYLAPYRVDVLIVAAFLSTLVSRGGLQGIWCRQSLIRGQLRLGLHNWSPPVPGRRAWALNTGTGRRLYISPTIDGRDTRRCITASKRMTKDTSHMMIGSRVGTSQQPRSPRPFTKFQDPLRPATDNQFNKSSALSWELIT
jgi:hypothetical protein